MIRSKETLRPFKEDPAPAPACIRNSQRDVVWNHEPQLCPMVAVDERRLERPQIRRGKEADFVQRNVAEYVEPPGTENPWESLCKQPDDSSKRRPDDQTVCDIVCLINVTWKFRPPGAAQLRNKKGTERNDVGRCA